MVNKRRAIRKFGFIIVLILLLPLLMNHPVYGSYADKTSLLNSYESKNNDKETNILQNGILASAQIPSSESNYSVVEQVYNPKVISQPLIPNQIRVVKELVEQRSRFSKAFLNSDGTTSVQTSVYSINYFDGHAWKEIDTTMRPDNKNLNYTHSMLANNFKVRLNNQGSNQSVSFSVEDQSVTYRANDMKNVTGIVYQDTITYVNAWQSTDLQYQVKNDQLKMELHLADNKAPKTFSFDLITKNVNYHKKRDGSIDFLNSKGEVAFQIPRLWVQDSSSNHKRYDRLKVEVKQKGNKMVLDLALDDRGLQYPIIIDPTTKLGAGSGHTLKLMNDGTILAWGYNVCGQLGNGTTSDSLTPVQVSGLTNVIAVASGYAHSLAVKQDGTVWAWGCNYTGQLGNGTLTNSVTPVQVIGLTNITTIAAGVDHSLAVNQDGNMWTWGYNEFGQLGNGNTNDRATPVQILNNVISFAAGEHHSVAIKQDGTVWTWGDNYYGQLGNGTNWEYFRPEEVIGLTNVTAIAAGLNHSLAVKQDGTVWAWGYNEFGQLGNGMTFDSLSPEQVIGLTNVAAITAGEFHSLALKQDGTVWAWGYNESGQLGNGTLTDSLTPEQVVGLTNVIDIAAGYNHSLAVKQNDSVWAWGSNYVGQLGNGLSGGIQKSPVQVIPVQVIDVPPLKITLTSSPQSSTDQPVTITVTVDSTDNLAVQLKLAVGNQSSSYFVTDGMVLTQNTFKVFSNGTYTVWAKDEAGNQTIQTIIISNINTNITIKNLKHKYNYDQFGRLINITVDATGQVWKSYLYDVNGNLISTIPTN